MLVVEEDTARAVDTERGAIVADRVAIAEPSKRVPAILWAAAIVDKSFDQLTQCLDKKLSCWERLLRS
jgi:hypothetical protein